MDKIKSSLILKCTNSSLVRLLFIVADDYIIEV